LLGSMGLAVENLEATIKKLKRKGWQSDGDPFEVPNGPCYCFADPSGNQMAIFQNLRPDAMEKSFGDMDNKNAIRE
jgi:predicted enzyme related to lactoylglutathione lyase